MTSLGSMALHQLKYIYDNIKKIMHNIHIVFHIRQQSWNIIILRYIKPHFSKNYCEFISKRILIIFAPEEAETFKDYLFTLA